MDDTLIIIILNPLQDFHYKLHILIILVKLDYAFLFFNFLNPFAKVKLIFIHFRFNLNVLIPLNM